MPPYHVNSIQMKPFAFSLLIGFMLAGTLSGCKRDTPEIEKKTDTWDEAAVYSLLRKTMWRVEKVFRVTGSGVVDLENDPNFDNKYFDYRKSVLLAFNDTGIDLISTDPMTGNPKFRKGAETYELNPRSVRPTGVSYKWDETRQTLVAVSGPPTGYLDIPAGFSGVLDKSSIITYGSYQEEEQATKPSGMVFEVETGNSVVYRYYLKPVWFYEARPDAANTYRYVVFP